MQFQSFSSSIEVLLGISNLFDADAGIFIFLYSTKMLFDGSLGIMRILYQVVSEAGVLLDTLAHVFTT